MAQVQTCYMCERLATTTEHAPPKSFFPKGSRKQLITVPSCDAHNNEKSTDDEYLRFIISINYENNPEAQSLFSKKVLKGLERKPHLLQSFTLDKGYPIIVDNKPSMAIRYDTDRYEKAMTYIAKAIHFHHFRTKWNEKLWILPVSARFSPQHYKHEEQNARLDILKNGEFNTPRYGENLEIFYYQFLVDEDNDKKRLRMVFYKGFVTYAMSLSIVTPKAQQVE